MNVSENELQAEEGRQVKSNPPPPPAKMAKNSPPLPVLSRSDRALRHKQGPSPQTGPFASNRAISAQTGPIPITERGPNRPTDC